jgi:cyclophilin family peptidyl-prolyl cis-trans isomerase
MSTTVKMQTTLGEMQIELDDVKAPITVKNFLAYVESGFYDGTIFHRVIPNFMIQGGGMTKEMKEKSNNAPIANEAANGLKNVRGTLAMARTADPNSATSQFFINHRDNAFLDYSGPSPDRIGYAVFGKVTQGLEVLDKIAAVKTKSVSYYDDVPVEAVEILSVQAV